MNCTEIQGKLIDYIEGGISNAEGQDIGAHLADCINCRQEKQAFEQIFATLKQESLPDPGDIYWQNFGKRVHHQIKKEMRADFVQQQWAGWKSFFTPRFAIPAFGLATLLVIGIILPMRKNSTPDLEQILSASTLTSDHAELIMALGDDPYMTDSTDEINDILI